MTAKLTIGIPVYNRFDFFEEAIESALGQTAPCRVVVLDNASNHNKFEQRCAELKKAGADVSYHRNEKNLGLFGNWNRCAEVADTEFVVILCDDDKLDRDYNAEFMKAYVAHPGMDYFYGLLNRFGTEFKGHDPQQILTGVFRGIEATALAAKSGLTWPTNATAYRTTHLRKHPFRFCMEKRASNADWMQVYTASADSLCVGSSKMLYHFRQHSQQSGHIYLQYAILTRSLIFAEMAEILAAAGKREWRDALMESVVTAVQVAIVMRAGIRKLVSDTLAENDAFVRFVIEFWAPRSSLVRKLYLPASSIEWNAAYATARAARLSLRVTDSVWRNLLLGDADKYLDEYRVYIKKFRGSYNDSGPVLPVS